MSEYTLVDLDTSGLSLLKLSKTKRTVNVFCKENKLIRFKTDKITMPFGASINKFKTQGPKDYYIDCNINQMLKTRIDLLSDKIIDLIYKNQELFELEHMDLETITNKWTCPIKTDSYSSKIKVKIARTRTGGMDLNVFDPNIGTTSKEQHVYIDDRNIMQLFQPKSSGEMLLRIGSIYYFREQFGMTFILNQIKLSSKAGTLDEPSDPDSEPEEKVVYDNQETMMDDF